MQPVNTGSRQSEIKLGHAEILRRPRFLSRMGNDHADRAPLRYDGDRLPPRAPSKRAKRSFAGRVGIFVTAVVLFVAGWMGAVRFVPGFPGDTQAGIDLVDRLAVASGFGISQVSVTGYSSTSDGAIFAALGDMKDRSIFFVDVDAARKRVEGLAWVKRASIARVLPGDVHIRIYERQPFAVWRRRNLFFLIDEDGRELEPVPPRAYAELPLVLGEGAAAKIAGLIGELRKFPTVYGLVDAVERVGDRRWSLHLAGGTVVHLPAREEMTALKTFAEMPGRADLLARRPNAVDLRLADRVTVRLQPNDARARAAKLRARRVIARRTGPVAASQVTRSRRGGGA